MDNKIQSLGKLFFLRSFSAHVLQRKQRTRSRLGKFRVRHYEECLRFFAAPSSAEPSRRAGKRDGEGASARFFPTNIGMLGEGPAGGVFRSFPWKGLVSELN